MGLWGKRSPRNNRLRGGDSKKEKRAGGRWVLRLSIGVEGKELLGRGGRGSEKKDLNLYRRQQEPGETGQKRLDPPVSFQENASTGRVRKLREKERGLFLVIERS